MQALILIQIKTDEEAKALAKESRILNSRSVIQKGDIINLILRGIL